MSKTSLRFKIYGFYYFEINKILSILDTTMAMRRKYHNLTTYPLPPPKKNYVKCLPI
jgi:hypothetical protein